MKSPSIVLFALALLTAGCLFVPAPYSAQLKPIAKRYSSIESGTPHREVEAQLGEPSGKEADGACVWETRIDQLNYTRIKVWFDVDDKVQKAEVTEAHGISHPGYHASMVNTRTK